MIEERQRKRWNVEINFKQKKKKTEITNKLKKKNIKLNLFVTYTNIYV